MRRNHENTNALAQATYREVVELKAQLNNIQSRLEAMTIQVEKATFNTVMGGGADISEFFPAESNIQINSFMDRAHPEWDGRKMEFYHFLYTIVSKNKRGFARGMIKALFARSYISTVKWPSSG